MESNLQLQLQPEKWQRGSAPRMAFRKSRKRISTMIYIDLTVTG
jgi:hypothetical protein